MYTHLLIPTEGSELSSRAIDSGLRLARCIGAHVTFVYVQPVFPQALGGEGALLAPESRAEFEQSSREHAKNILGEALASAQTVGVAAQSETAVSDYPFQVIVNTAQNNGCDLIFMASHGRKGLAGLLIGSETHKVVTHSTVPVLVYR